MCAALAPTIPSEFHENVGFRGSKMKTSILSKCHRCLLGVTL